MVVVMMIMTTVMVVVTTTTTTITMTTTIMTGLGRQVPHLPAEARLPDGDGPAGPLLPATAVQRHGHPPPPAPSCPPPPSPTAPTPTQTSCPPSGPGSCPTWCPAPCPLASPASSLERCPRLQVGHTGTDTHRQARAYSRTHAGRHTYRHMHARTHARARAHTHIYARIHTTHARIHTHTHKLVVVCGHCLVTLSFTIDETLKWLSSLPILMQKSFWW